MAYKVGLRRLFYQDTDRSNWDGTNPRPLLTDVWYPAVDTAVEVDVSIGPPNMPFFNAGKSARDAELVFAPASFPLVLLSHGSGGVWWCAHTHFYERPTTTVQITTPALRDTHTKNVKFDGRQYWIKG